MKRINCTDFLGSKGELAATIGFFDGVHAGHRFLIDQLKSNAAGLPTVVVTFPQHPRLSLQSCYMPKLLTTFDEKMDQLSATGIDFCFLLDFTKSISQLSAKEFIHDLLRKQMRISRLLIGYDHRFGKDRAEGFDEYVRYGKDCGMTVIQALELPANGFHVSSTTIRNQLVEKRLEIANQLLSYSYQLQGKVIQGNKLGRRIGFPTANLEIVDKNKVIPGEGIYAAWTYADNKKYPGMVYIGKRPTVLAHGEQRLEVHLLDYSGDLYGKILRLEFVKFLRDDKHFNGLEELSVQLSIDREQVRRELVR
jgi:riboflavin kinase/FMN adenylyltransferase